LTHLNASRLLTHSPRITSLDFHHPGHTLDPILGVVARTAWYCSSLELCEEETELAITAAYFHDIGHHFKKHNHERTSILLAKPSLEAIGYAPEEIETVCSAILDTRFVENKHPKSHLGEILCDADTENFGRADFFEKGEALRREEGIKDKLKWYEGSLYVAENIHTFYTPIAKDLFQSQKETNMATLQRLIELERR
jgi:HD superfamily phosphodiesterase